MRIPYISLLAAAALGLGGCAYGGLGLGYGDGYYGSSYYGGGYYGGGYGSYYGAGYASPYYGWYNDFYYPGTGYYVYDRYRRPHAWNDSQRRYWTQRQNSWRGHSNNSHQRMSANWSGFNHRSDNNHRRNH